MSIKSLTLHNFRNYSAQNFNFTADKVVLVGENGRGKTNVLEAVSVLSTTKSWREASGFDQQNQKTNNLIQEKSPNSLISLTTSADDIYEAQISPRSRVFTKNQKKIPRKKYLGQIPTLLFVPEYLEIFSGPKSPRQSFFDRFFCQFDPAYKDLLAQTMRAVKQKSAIFREVLYQGSDYSHLDKLLAPWDQILTENIPQIWKSRETFLSELEPILQAELSKISANNDEIKLYLHRSEADNFTQKNNSLDFAREIRVGRVLFSPTRDDFLFYYRDRPMTDTVSRGETRSILLSLLAAQKQYFLQKTGESPILLLDDCFSELDDNRQQGLERLCEGTQAFFTTTHHEHFSQFMNQVQKIDI